MSVARSAAEVLRDHVVLEVEAIDRMYLNVYVPHLQSVGAVVGYLRVHRGQRFASTTAVTPMTEAFVRNIDRFVNDEGVDLVTFQKGQRKDDVTQKYVRKFTRREGVLYVGKAQEKARVMRTERRCSRFTGGTYPWIVESTAMVNHYYFYCVDEDFGPFFLKFCSYFPYNAKLCINGNEYLKRQLAKRGVAFEALDNGVKSCANPKLMQRLCDELSADKICRGIYLIVHLGWIGGELAGRASGALTRTGAPRSPPAWHRIRRHDQGTEGHSREDWFAGAGEAARQCEPSLQDAGLLAR